MKRIEDVSELGKRLTQMLERGRQCREELEFEKMAIVENGAGGYIERDYYIIMDMSREVDSIMCFTSRMGTIEFTDTPLVNTRQADLNRFISSVNFLYEKLGDFMLENDGSMYMVPINIVFRKPLRVTYDFASATPLREFLQEKEHE